MNVLRAFARDLMNSIAADSLSRQAPGVSGLNAVRQQRVAPVVDATRYRDSFDQLPQGAGGVRATLRTERRHFHSALSAARSDSFLRDGFERGHRPPLDLSGGVKPALPLPEQVARKAAVPANGFVASLDDLL